LFFIYQFRLLGKLLGIIENTWHRISDSTRNLTINKFIKEEIEVKEKELILRNERLNTDLRLERLKQEFLESNRDKEFVHRLFGQSAELPSQVAHQKHSQ